MMRMKQQHALPFTTLCLALMALPGARASTDSARLPVPDDTTTQTLMSLENETDILKAQATRQDALNALEESRRKGDALKNSEPLPVTASVSAGPRAREPQAASPARTVPARLTEIWSQGKNLYAAVESAGRRITLQAGDRWPGSTLTIRSISARGVTLDNGQEIHTGGTL